MDNVCPMPIEYLVDPQIDKMPTCLMVLYSSLQGWLMRLAAYCSTHWNASLAFTNENSEIHLNQEIVFFLRVETRVADLGFHFILLNIYTLLNIQMEGGWNLNGISAGM